MQTVEIPGQGVASFPDDMTPEQIKGVIKRKFYPESSTTPATDKAVSETRQKDSIVDRVMTFIGGSDWKKNLAAGAKPMEPLGASEGAGLMQGLAEFDKATGGEVGGGVGDILQGNVARGVHRILSGAGTAATVPTLPFIAPALISSPLIGAGVVGGTIAGGKIGEKTAEKLGATPEQAAVAGDIGQIIGGTLGGGGGSIASKIASPKIVPELEVRPRVGEKTSLRQSGETPEAQKEAQGVEQILEKKGGELVEEKVPKDKRDVAAQGSGSVPEGATRPEQETRGTERVRGQEQVLLEGEGAAAPPPPQTTGIAQRVHEERFREGRQGPIMPGEGVSAEEQVQRGQELIKTAKANPVELLNQMRQTGNLSGDNMAVLRAHHAELGRQTNQAYQEWQANPDSPLARMDYDRAWNNETQWAKDIKPFQTEWHKIGQAMQGETDIDTGSFLGLRRAVNDFHGRDVTPQEVPKLTAMAKKVQQVNRDVDIAKSKYDDLVKKATANRSPRSLDELKQHFSDRIRALTPC